MKLSRRVDARARRGRVRRIVPTFFCGFLVGVAGCGAVCVVLDKAARLNGTSVFQRVGQLSLLSRDLGFSHFRACERKVNDLHVALVSQDASQDWRQQESTGIEAGRLLASIVVDGRSCNEHLLKLTRNQTPVDRVVVYRSLRAARGSGGNLGPAIECEADLALWALDAINPELNVVVPTDLATECESSVVERIRNRSIAQYRRALGWEESD